MGTSINLLLFTIILSFTHLSHAEIYKWVDKQGRVHFSDRKPADQKKVENVQVRINTYKGVSYADSFIDTGKRVIMYTTDWCNVCKRAKAYFAKNHIAYTEFDIEKDADAMQKYKNLGGRGVPLILVGKKRMSGFSEKGFTRIYQ